MHFDRCAGGHNFDFDTDVCTRCGIDRRQYRDGGNPECVPRHIVRIATTTTWQIRCQVRLPRDTEDERALAVAEEALSFASSAVRAQEREIQPWGAVQGLSF